MSTDKFETFIRQALENRKSLTSELSIFRLFDGIADSISDLYIDYYDKIILAHYLPSTLKAEKQIPQIEEVLKIYSTIFTEASIYIRIHPLDSQKHKSAGAKLIAGPEVDETIAKEGELQFLLNIPRSPHAGLYADMREIRQTLSKKSGAKTINLFSFTGSLGLAAALGGAQEILQVDSNPAALQWSKKNQELNQHKLGNANIKYFCNDSMFFLKREISLINNGAPRANLIICDPPSFGRSKAGSFSFKNNASELINLCLRALSPNGRLIFTCNSRSYTATMIADLIKTEAKSTGFKIENLSILEPPEIDFPAKNSDSIAMRGAILN